MDDISTFDQDMINISTSANRIKRVKCHSKLLLVVPENPILKSYAEETFMNLETKSRNEFINFCCQTFVVKLEFLNFRLYYEMPFQVSASTFTPVHHHATFILSRGI